MKTIQKKTEDDIIKMYLDCKTISLISKTLKVTRAEIYGAIKRNKIQLHNKHPKIGERFGYLEVIGLKNDYVSHRKRNILMAECYCHNCQRPYYLVSVASIKRGSTKSCGCMREQYSKITGKNNRSFNGHEEIRGHFWAAIRKRAKLRKIEFSLSIKDAWNIYVKQNGCCALTGMPIGFGRSEHRNENTASLDRINSLLGYIKGNVQWVHKDVNRMKYSMSQEYFVNLCRMVTNNKNLSTITDMNFYQISKNRSENIGAMQ